MKLPFALLATVLVWNVLALVAPRSKLVPRFDEDDVASNELWQRVTCKGGRLIAAMLGSDEDAGKLIDDKRTPSSASSVWQGDLKSELSKWKWFDIPTDDPDEQERGNHDGYWHVESAIEALRLNGKPGSDNVVYTVQHSNPELMDSVGHHAPVASQTYDVDGEKYTATGASYEFVINYKGGVIYAQDILSPMHGARQEWYREPQHKELPHLNKFSDVLWGYWVRDNANIKNIKYFWVEGVVNIDTNSIIATALKAAGKTLAVWPGTTFDMNTEAGKAILGSDNGASFAWFLIQRKAQLGNKWISKVTVFYSDEDFSGNDPHLLFHVEDTPPLQSGKKASSVLRARGRGQGLVDKVPPIEQQSPRNFRRVHVFNSASYLGSSRGGSNAFVALQNRRIATSPNIGTREDSQHTNLSRVVGSTIAIPDGEPSTVKIALTKHIADDGVWFSAVCRGAKLNSAMVASDEEAGKMYQDTRQPPSAQSEWRGDLQQELETWGWQNEWVPATRCDFDNFWNYGPAMRELGLSSGCKGSQRGGYNIPYSVLHGFPAGGLNPEQQKYTVDGRTYGKSGAYYKFVVNPIEGAIYAQNVHSPSGQKGKNWIDLPKLRALSDVLWGYWNRENPNVKNINKFLMQTVVNRDSQRIIARAFRQTGKTFGGWPGTDFSMDSMEGWAILGSPNGAAFGHFLMGHKAELGLKRISKVKVVILDAEEFPDQTEAAPDLVFFVEDVPPGTEVPWYPNPPSGVVAHQLDVRNSSSEVPLRAML